MRKHIIIALSLLAGVFALTGCFSAKTASTSGRGGEVVGVAGKAFTEPTPYGMTRINRGFLKMGLDKLSVSPAMVLPLRKKIRECE